ncbi:hypothetical protein PMAYCL1PPCAC_24920, partial [Pristionchus mayeri]
EPLNGFTSNKGRRRRKTGPKQQIWNAPISVDHVEKSSMRMHACPQCRRAHTGCSGLTQHLTNAHNLTLTEAGRWIHCEACGSNFGSDCSWRKHCHDTDCPKLDVSIRWWEKKGEEGRNEDKDKSIDESHMQVVGSQIYTRTERDEVPVDVKIEPKDDFPDIKQEEPIADMFCPATGHSRPIDQRERNWRERDSLSIQYVGSCRMSQCQLVTAIRLKRRCDCLYFLHSTHL